MTKVLPESDNAELARLNPAHVGDHIAHGRSHSGAGRPSCGDDWANIHAGSVRQMFPAIVPVSESTGDPHEQVGFNCFCRGPCTHHGWRAGHAAGSSRCVQWRGDHPGCTRLRPGRTSRTLRPLPAALRLPARLAHRPLRRPLLPQSLVLTGWHGAGGGSAHPPMLARPGDGAGLAYPARAGVGRPLRKPARAARRSPNPTNSRTRFPGRKPASMCRRYSR